MVKYIFVVLETSTLSSNIRLGSILGVGVPSFRKLVGNVSPPDGWTEIYV